MAITRPEQSAVGMAVVACLRQNPVCADLSIVAAQQELAWHRLPPVSDQTLKKFGDREARNRGRVCNDSWLHTREFRRVSLCDSRSVLVSR
jgi:hypothetical protein